MSRAVSEDRNREWKLPPERAGHEASDDLVGRRQMAASMPVRVPDGVAVRDVIVNGVSCVACETPEPVATLVYFHGGGYRMGSAAAWTSLAASLARTADMRVVVPEYRLAPEFPYPAALHDAAGVYDATLNSGLDSGDPVLLGGDSAGGGLALAVTIAARAVGAPLPAGLVLLSPWVDLTVTAATYQANATSDQFFSETAARDASDAYLQGHDARDPFVSPLFADLDGLPPALVIAGGDEVLLDDILALTGHLAHAGASVQTHIVAGMQHVFPLMYADHAETAAALDAVARFVTRLR
jgi:acetyl esterase/lipase